MFNIKDNDLYFVGGAVRDELLGIKSPDTDFCYVGNAIDYALANFGSNIVKINEKFGTVRVVLNGHEIDIASTRLETYPKAGHLPVITKIGCSLKEDLKRRDFTVNTLAKNTLTNEIIDLYNGIEDLKNKKLRVLHDKSFIDDPTRIVRGLKFSVRLNFELEEHTLKLQQEYLNNINYDMSYHRLKKELIETFNINKQEVYDKFITQKIYHLLNESKKAPTNNCIIQNNFQQDDRYIWLKYLAMFDLSNINLTKKEKQIINNSNTNN